MTSCSNRGLAAVIHSRYSSNVHQIQEYPLDERYVHRRSTMALTGQRRQAYPKPRATWSALNGNQRSGVKFFLELWQFLTT